MWQQIAQEGLGAISTAFQMWQAADRERKMRHAVDDALRQLRGISGDATRSVLGNAKFNSPENYALNVNQGAKAAETNYGSSMLPSSSGRFAATAADKASIGASNQAAAKNQGWQTAALQQMIKNMQTGSQLGLSQDYAQLATYPLPAQLNAAQNADQWINFLVAQLNSAQQGVGSMGGGGGGGGGMGGGMGGGFGG